MKTVSELPPPLRQLTSFLFGMEIIATLAFGIVDTFLVLYMISLIGYQALSVVIAVKLTVQTVLDYPTGVLGDRIGQKKVLLLAYTSYVLAALLFYSANGFWLALTGYIFSAVGASQESGALSSWYDSRYREYARKNNYDLEKKRFAEVKTSLRLAVQITFGISFVIGGYVSTLTSRRTLILIHLITLLCITIFIAAKMRDSSHTERGEEDEKEHTHILDGLKFLTSSRPVLLTYLGVSLLWAIGGAIWANLILFPYYESYGKTDLMTGSLRSLIFVISSVMMVAGARIITRLSDEKLWITVGYLITSPLFFFLAWLYYVIVPPLDSFDWLRFLGVALVFAPTGFGEIITEVFWNRIQLSIVPNEIRNSVYSLIPSLSTVFSIFLAPLGGLLIKRIGFGSTIVAVAGMALLSLFFMTWGVRGLELDRDRRTNS